MSRLRAFVTGATTRPRGDGVDADDDDASPSRQALGKRQRRTRQSRIARCRRARFVVKNGRNRNRPLTHICDITKRFAVDVAQSLRIGGGIVLAQDPVLRRQRPFANGQAIRAGIKHAAFKALLDLKRQSLNAPLRSGE